MPYGVMTRKDVLWLSNPYALYLNLPNENLLFRLFISYASRMITCSLHIECIPSFRRSESSIRVTLESRY